MLGWEVMNCRGLKIMILAELDRQYSEGLSAGKDYSEVCTTVAQIFGLRSWSIVEEIWAEANPCS